MLAARSEVGSSPLNILLAFFGSTLMGDTWILGFVGLRALLVVRSEGHSEFLYVQSAGNDGEEFFFF